MYCILWERRIRILCTQITRHHAYTIVWANIKQRIESNRMRCCGLFPCWCFQVEILFDVMHVITFQLVLVDQPKFNSATSIQKKWEHIMRIRTVTKRISHNNNNNNKNLNKQGSHSANGTAAPKLFCLNTWTQTISSSWKQRDRATSFSVRLLIWSHSIKRIKDILWCSESQNK